MIQQPIPTSSILFSPQSTNFSSTLTSLKRSTLSIKNRLRSITSDAEFVTKVASSYNLPLIANERCGSWYIRPEQKAGSAYFKSTDGHAGQWGFNLRRLNVQVFDVVEKYGGCVVVDSTRRGKVMPDALMKTVPIWCAVFNRVLFPEDLPSWRLFTPPNCVSRSEHSQIEKLLDGFVNDLKMLQLDITGMRKKVSRPLRPIWVTHSSELPEIPPDYTDFHPVILCTASRRVAGTEVSEGGYIQGAGDDSEGWSHDLTPGVFWKHEKELLEANEEDLLELIASYLEDEQSALGNSKTISITQASWLSIGSLNSIEEFTITEYDAIITVGQQSALAEIKATKIKHLHLECRDKKLGSRDLRSQLPLLIWFFGRISSSAPRILVCCSGGKDISAGVALAILCLYSDATGHYQQMATQSSAIDKIFIKQRLSWIMTSHPGASPSRATLQSINDFLLTEHTVRLPILNKKSDESNQSEEAISEILFNELAGEWTLERSIVNFRNDGLAGTVSGTATFTPKGATSDDTKFEYLYREEGTFIAGPGMQMTVRRNWIWRLSNSQQPGISIHFVQADGETEDYLYNKLGALEEDAQEDNGMKLFKIAVEHHCDEDFYVSTYRFYTKDTKLGKWDVKHEVKGPAKDYISRTTHTRKSS